MSVFRAAALALVSVPFATPLRAEASVMPAEIATAIAEVQTLVRHQGGKLWQGLDKAPFGFLLVEQDREILACENRLPDGFKSAGQDSNLKCPLATGPRSWRLPHLLAAMPAFGPPSTIVMGSPQGTGKTLPEWQATVIHENFHQWQATLPRYYERVEALGLANGDQTGMWMLNYSFPYADEKVQAAYARASRALAEAVSASGREFRRKSKAYLEARAQFEAAVSATDWRYFEFQLWQEGVARWTELSIAERAKDRALAATGRKLRQTVVADLLAPDLKRDGRVAVYAFGAGEAMLLERMRPGWRRGYQRELALGPLFRAH